MATLTSLLHVGASGLRAATLGVNVTSQNATNATTPGYSRRALVQSPVPGPPEGGGGVWARGPSRITDPFIERRLLGATSASAGASAQRQLAEAANVAMSEGAGGLGDALSALETALREASSSPSDLGRRAAVVARASNVADAFKSASQSVVDARREADQRVVDAVAEVNRLSAQIEHLQREIRESEITGVEASDLRDTRDQKVRELAALVPASVLDGPNGTVTVLLAGGRALVHAEGGASPLSTDVDATTGHVIVTAKMSGADVDITGELEGGEIGGLIAARDGVLKQSEDDLDQLASDVAAQLNAAHVTGFGLDGVSGRNLFTPVASVSGAARSLSVDAAVAGDPRAVALAQDPALVPGDNRGALALIDVFSTAFARGGTTTPGGAVAAMVADVGNAIVDADANVSRSSAQLAQVTSLRDSISGTSSDDEMVSLMSYQRAYEASLRVVSAADQMMQELLQLGAR